MAETSEFLTSAAPCARASDSSAASRTAEPTSRWGYVALVLFLLIVCAAVLAEPLISAPLLRRIPDGWSWHVYYVGRSAVPDPNTGKFGELIPGTYQRTMAIDGPGAVPGSIKIVDDYVIQDPLTRKTIWRYTVYPSVDPATGMRAEPDYRGQYFVFPRNVQRTTYVLRQNYLKGVPMAFVEEDAIEGVPVYVFQYRGRGEYTESYAGSADYPGTPVAAGQEIKCADDQFYLRLWVEPLTGEVVKMNEGCESGDYVYDVATGKQLAPVLVWAGQTEGSGVLARVNQVRDERLRILLANYLPIGLALLAIALGAAILIERRFRA
jgi:hypothetical protein